MKKKISSGFALLVLLVVQSTIVQSQALEFLYPIIVRDNGSGVDTLHFGYDVGATRCIDISLGEQELPPAPPTGVFDARWGDPAAVNECMGQGLRVNIHGWNSYSYLDTFKITFQPGDGGFPMHFCWPAGLNAVFGSMALKDPFGFGIINVDMLRDTCYDLTNSAFTSLLIFANPLCWCGVRQVSDVVPAAFELGQNYPNPFNPSTTIQFGVKEESFVALEVFDQLGRIMKELVSQQLSPATYSVVWDGTGVTGDQAGSGTYFVRMSAVPTRSAGRTDSFTTSRKIMLVR
jgi:hypothetical protein